MLKDFIGSNASPKYKQRKWL